MVNKTKWLLKPLGSGSKAALLCGGYWVIKIDIHISTQSCVVDRLSISWVEMEKRQLFSISTPEVRTTIAASVAAVTIATTVWGLFS